MAKVRLPHHFDPRPYQVPLMDALDSGQNRAVWVVHRRGGKDKTCINIAAKKMMERVGTYYHIFPTYSQAKKAIWLGRDKAGFPFLGHFPKELVVRKNKQDMLVEYRNGSIFQLIGSDNIDAIMGTNPVGCIFSEFSLQDPAAWDYLRPILLENGGWAIFIFTPRGKNHAYQLVETAKKNGWFCEELGVDKTKDWDGNPIITPEMIQEERNSGMDEDLIQQEYYCAFSAVVPGAYYGTQMKFLEENNRYVKGLWDPKLPVETWWDLGMDDSTTILFTQVFQKEIRFIDYLEDSGEGLEFYAKKLGEKPYAYAAHHFPHDGEVKELGTGKTRKETAQSLGIRPLDCIAAPQAKMDGIQSVRSILPRVWIDQEKCQRLIDCLLNYTKQWDEKNKTWKNYPAHTWASHGADAVQTFALGFKDRLKFMVERAPRVEYDKMGRPIYNRM